MSTPSPSPHPGPTRPEPSLRETVRADFEAMAPSNGHRGPRRFVELAVKLAVIPKLRAVLYYRWGHALCRRGLLPLAYFLEARAIKASGAEIHPMATIGPGLTVQHSVGLVIGPYVRIGDRAMLYQGVTLGDGSRPGQPTIGDDVYIGAGASVLGPVTIGNRVVIGANAVVTRDLPDDVIATGTPATYRPRPVSTPNHP